MLMLRAEVDDGFVLFRQGFGTVADENGEVGIFHSLAGTLHTHGFDPVFRFADAGGVDQPQTGLAHHDGFFNRITGGTGHFRNDHTVVTCQCVEQAGLTDIGLAHNGGCNTTSQNAALIVGLQQFGKGFGISFQCIFITCETEILNVLIRVVQHRMEMAAQVGQIIVDGIQFFLQLAAHLSGSVGGSFGGFSFNQVNDCFRLGQIQLTVQKRALGKFTTLGRSCAGAVQCFQTGSQHGGGTVAMKLHRILTGIAVRTTGIDGAAGIDDAALLVVQVTQNQLPVGCLLQRLLI